MAFMPVDDGDAALGELLLGNGCGDPFLPLWDDAPLPSAAVDAPPAALATHFRCLEAGHGAACERCARPALPLRVAPQRLGCGDLATETSA